MDEALVYEILSVVEEIPAGRLAPGFSEQRPRLLAEGVGFLKNGCVDMAHFCWEC